jgi:transposase InsO family protein
MSRLKFGKEIDHQASAPNDLVAADVCGPIVTQVQADGTEIKHYFSLIVDVYSRHVNVRLITSKQEASDHCISYFHQSRISTGNALRHFHTDGGKEYNRCEQVFERHGVKVTRTPVHTPQHNGIAERKNRTLLDMALALCQHAGYDAKKHFRHALEMAVHLHNRVCAFQAGQDLL